MAGLSVAKSLGHHGHWGFSSGFDILQGMNSTNIDSTLQPINILLVQPGDIRHILYTISRRRRHKSNKRDTLRPIHFYLYEPTMEILARNLLLLEAINDYEVPIRQRANTFLEIFGNNKVQRRTSLYIEQIGTQLRLLVTKGTGQLDNVIDFSLMRYREKDELELAFKAYSRFCVFDMNSLYDHRQRGLYEDRFDSRKALFDWDYHSTLKKKASIVHIKQFKEWRNSGIAFEFGDQTYTEPNKTLMSYTEGTMKKGKEKGIKKEVKGFWGDISVSPYFSFGVDSETPNKHAEGLYEIYNKNSGTEQHRHHAVEVALYNLFAVLWETETGQIYRMTKSNDIYSGLGSEASILSSKLDSLDNSNDESAAVTTDVVGKSHENDLPVIEEVDEENFESENAADNTNDESSSSSSASVVSKNIVDESEVDIDLSGMDVNSKSDTQVKTDIDDGSGVSIDKQENNAVQTLISSNDDSSNNITHEDSRVKDVAKAVQRAETIAETYNNVKIFPLSGPSAGTLDKAKYRDFFDCIYVSSRSAQILGESYFGSLLKEGHENGAYAAVETGKFLVPLSQDLKDELLKKEIELAQQLGWKKIPAPVPRRRRDELDIEDDVIFFRR